MDTNRPFPIFTKFVGKVERGPRKKPLDFGGNPDRVTLYRHTPHGRICVIRRFINQCVLNSAARIVSNTRKFDRGLTHFRRSQLYTGWTLSTGFGSESASRCSDVCTRWLLNTCRPTANPSPAFLVVATCDWLTVVISTSHV